MASQAPSAGEPAEHVAVVVAFLVAAPLALLMASGWPALFVSVLALVLLAAVRIVPALVRALR